MAQGYRIKGLDKLQRKLARLPEQVKSQVIADIEDTADAIVIKASEAAPVDLGVLKQSIGNEPKNNGLNYIVFVGAEYAPFVEFGTGSEIEIPSELKDYASQFRGEKKVNLRAQPFFFPAYFSERDKLLEALRVSIKKFL